MFTICVNIVRNQEIEIGHNQREKDGSGAGKFDSKIRIGNSTEDETNYSKAAICRISCLRTNNNVNSRTYQYLRTDYERMVNCT